MFPSTASESAISSTKLRAVLIILITLILAGCGAKPKKEAVYRVIIQEIPQPTNLTAESSNGKATIYWKINRTLNEPISGYRIFLGDKSYISDTATWRLTPGAPYNSDLYPGDTDSDYQNESFKFEDLENGRAYYAMVRTVGIDNRESASSNVVSFRPLAKGEFTISSNHLAENGGFNFETETRVPGKDKRSDLYLYSNGSKTGLSSPSRLSGGLRKTLFSSGGDENLETITIKAGDKLKIKTKYGEVDLVVISLDGNSPNISARLRYTFYPGAR